MIVKSLKAGSAMSSNLSRGVGTGTFCRLAAGSAVIGPDQQPLDACSRTSSFMENNLAGELSTIE
jgi:hypothetical protein